VASTALALVPHEDFLGNSGDVFTLTSKDMTNGEPAPANKGVTRHIMKVPLVGPKRTMKPNGVIQAGGEQHLVKDFNGF